jgi:hypothetical protein
MFEGFIIMVSNTSIIADELLDPVSRDRNTHKRPLRAAHRHGRWLISCGSMSSRIASGRGRTNEGFWVYDICDGESEGQGGPGELVE